jgi:hypothetical protein
MNPTQLEFEIAAIAKWYCTHELGLDIQTFTKTKNRAWVSLVGRILSKPGAVIPVKSANRYERGIKA